ELGGVEPHLVKFVSAALTPATGWDAVLADSRELPSSRGALAAPISPSVRGTWSIRHCSDAPPSTAKYSSAIHHQIVVCDCRRPICIDRNMKGLMHQKVITWTLTDDPEVVHKREVCLPVLERSLEGLFGDAGRLEFDPRGLANATDALGLEM